MSLANAPGVWRWEQRESGWWHVHDELRINDGPHEHKGIEYRVDVLAHGESTWATNALRFGTFDEARAYASDLYSRWTMAQRLRVVTDDTPDRERYVTDDDRIVIGAEVS